VRVHVDAAANATRDLLDAPPGVVEIAEDRLGGVDPKWLEGNITAR
jgi:hypothetical protein